MGVVREIRRKRRYSVFRKRRRFFGGSPGVEDGFNVCAGAVLARGGFSLEGK